MTIVRTFRCMVCWRRQGWEKGCADDVDEILSAAATRGVFAHAGICDDCWDALGGADLTAVAS